MSSISIRIIKLCVPNLVAVRRSCRNRGGGGYRQTDKGTLHLYIVDSGKKAVRIITLSGYSTHSEPLFKQLNMLKIADQ